jgi:hypothetical protein
MFVVVTPVTVQGSFVAAQVVVHVPRNPPGPEVQSLNFAVTMLRIVELSTRAVKVD